MIKISVVIGYVTITGFHATQEGRRTREFIRDHEIYSLGMAVSAHLYRTAERYNRVGEELLQDDFLRDWILAGEVNEEALRVFLENVRERYGMLDASIVSDRSETYYGTDGRTLALSPENTERDGWYYLYRDADVDTNIDAWYYPETGMVGMWVNTAIRDTDGRFLGVTGGGVELEDFSATLHAFGELPEVQVYLARRDGRLVYASDRLLLKSHACTSSLWDIPLGDLFPDEPSTGSWAIVDSFGVTGPMLFVGYSDTWDTFVILEKSGNSIRARMRSTVLNSLATAGVLTLAFTFFTLLMVRVARTRIDSQARRLEELAGKDMLTGLDNRLRFTETVMSEYARVCRTGEKSSLLLMDLDRFKDVNDTFGHPVGDTVLAKAAAVIRANVRDTDHVARFGGEEFIILLPGTSTEGARMAAEKIRSAVSECTFPAPAEELRITASFGVAPLVEDESSVSCSDGSPKPATRVDQAYQKADEALYRAKRNGRNRVEVATPA